MICEVTWNGTLTQLTGFTQVENESDRIKGGLGSLFALWNNSHDVFTFGCLNINVETHLPIANTVRATEDPLLLCILSYTSGLNMPSQMMGAFQEVHVCTSGLDLK